MPFDISMRLKSVGKLSEGPRIIAEAKEQGLKVGGELLVSQIKKLTPVDTGRLRASVVFLGRGPDKGVLASPVVYSSVMEYGRRPGKFPPPGPMQLWVRRKLRISNQKDIRSIAFLVSRKIARAGIEGRHMFDKGIKAGWPRAKRAMESIIKRIIIQRLSA